MTQLDPPHGVGGAAPRLSRAQIARASRRRKKARTISVRVDLPPGVLERLRERGDITVGLDDPHRLAVELGLVLEDTP